jgi:flagellin-specific chaperone FliS
MAQLQDAMPQELRSRIHILQSEDNQIVNEATDLFNGMRQELDAQSKRISDNTLQILAVKVTTQTIQKRVSILTKRIDEVNKIMVAITTSLKNIPSKRDLRLDPPIMEEQMAQVADVNTGWTTAMEG